MRRDERDLPGCFWVCVLLMAGWGASAAGQCGVEERGQHGRVPAASTEAGEEREIPACSDAPADACERRAGPDVSAVDLPGSAGGPVVAHGVRVAPGLVHARRDERERLALARVRRSDVRRDVRQFDGAGHVMGRSEMGDEAENQSEDRHGAPE